MDPKQEGEGHFPCVAEGWNPKNEENSNVFMKVKLLPKRALELISLTVGHLLTK